MRFVVRPIGLTYGLFLPTRELNKWSSSQIAMIWFFAVMRVREELGRKEGVLEF